MISTPPPDVEQPRQTAVGLLKDAIVDAETGSLAVDAAVKVVLRYQWRSHEPEEGTVQVQHALDKVAAKLLVRLEAALHGHPSDAKFEANRAKVARHRSEGSAGSSSEGRRAT